MMPTFPPPTSLAESIDSLSNTDKILEDLPHEGQNGETTTTSTLEIEFSLDHKGRTRLIGDVHQAGEIDYTSRTWWITPSRNETNRNVGVEEKNNRSDDDDDASKNEAALLSVSATNTSTNTASTDAAHIQLWNDLLLDCEIADFAMMPRTFWVPASSSAAAVDGHDHFIPRFTLEHWARDIFDHHTASLSSSSSSSATAGPLYDPARSGAEWWVQIRPSPSQTGRYALGSDDPNQRQAGQPAQQNGNNAQGERQDPGENHDQDMAEEGISFHWDKDEELRVVTEGQVYVHPHWSTVTYLTSVGAPTLAVNRRVLDNVTGSWLEGPPSTTTTRSSLTSLTTDTASNVGVDLPANTTTAKNDHEDEHIPTAFLSWPAAGKHLCFDGRYLHAAPPSLAYQPPEKEPLLGQLVAQEGHDFQEPNTHRRQRRVTFLVNIWLNYIPLDVHPFPAAMVDKMSGYGAPCHLHFSPAVLPVQRWVVQQGRARHEDVGRHDGDMTKSNVVVPDSNPSGGESCPVQKFVWPMGDCNSDEWIHMELPWAAWRSQQAATGSQGGDNIRIQWQPDSTGQVGLELIRGRRCSHPLPAPSSAEIDDHVEGTMATPSEPTLVASRKRPHLDLPSNI